MATLLRAPFTAPPPQSLTAICTQSPKAFHLSLTRRCALNPSRLTSSLRFSPILHIRFLRFDPFASNGEATETQEVQDSEIEENSDGYIGGAEDATSDSDAPDSDAPDAEEEPASGIIVALRSYKEALVSNDESKAAEIEAFIKSIEDEKIDLEKKVGALSEELSSDKERILRISADFDNFRKRTDRERLSLVTNAQGEVLENLLPVLDNFERAKAQIKVETEGEEKINNSYQSIYKQFVEILGSLGVTPVETIGNPFDPLFHEAIMREDSTEFEEDVIIQEFRKGFKLGDRLLRPSMVKVSAGPGPAKVEAVGSSEEEAVRVTETETSVEGTPEGESG
ncbi:protein GrpE isoform X1 [Vitis riparia]|uniref:protein GrpE isoform X1 n=1 Tax=Vitis riparia TaxID=96939 RepID=UPI00155AED44|nr:protein GrpE isoform X1 [Vitis riparia]